MAPRPPGVTTPSSSPAPGGANYTTAGGANYAAPGGAAYDVMSLEQALAVAYDSNPALSAARAELRGIDETYAQAESGFRPALSGEASYQTERLDGNVDLTHEDPKTLALVLSQPVYSGGTTVAQMAAAKNNVMAGRARVRQSEQGVLLQAITAYMDVLRDQQVVSLNRNNEDVLRKQLEAARARFSLGDITQTDVRQSESRLANAAAGLAAANGQWQSSRAAFESVIGMQPETLAMPDQGIVLPATLDEALQQADQSSPALVNARYASRAAQSSTRAIVGEGLPQVDLSGQVARVYDPVQSFDDRQTDTSLLVRATMPFYTGGKLDSRVRQAHELERQRLHEADNAARNVRQAVIDAWQNLAAARAQSTARQTQIEAARLARDGVKAEAQYGSRTTLDVLDAEQEYLNAQVGFVSAEHDRMVAAYALVAAIGGLSPETLKLDTQSYDSARHFAQIKDKWIGYSAPKAR